MRATRRWKADDPYFFIFFPLQQFFTPLFSQPTNEIWFSVKLMFLTYVEMMGRGDFLCFQNKNKKPTEIWITGFATPCRTYLYDHSLFFVSFFWLSWTQKKSKLYRIQKFGGNIVNFHDNLNFFDQRLWVDF